MTSGGASAIESDLATGTTATSKARRRWPILDVHDVKQQSFHVRRNDEFRRRTSNARNLHAGRVTRAASPPIADTCLHGRPNADDARRVKAKTFVLESFVGPSGPSCLSAEGFGPPPVSPVFLNPIRVAWFVIGNRHSSRIRSRNRSTDIPVGRRRRGARCVCLCGASGFSSCR
jgi:hypothetical protein